MYSAYLNGVKFFDTDSELDSLLLTSASVKLKAGSAGSFTFIVPPCNSQYDNFHRLVDYVDVYDGDNLIFAGRVFSVEMTFDTQYKIECEGLLSVLCDSIYRPTTYTGSVRDLILNILASHNGQVSADKHINIGQVTIPDYTIYNKEFRNYDSSISRIKELVETYGGTIYVRKAAGQLYFDWLRTSITYSDQTICLGENLLDFTKKQDSSNVVTVLIPTGAQTSDGSKLTISSVNGGRDYIYARQELIDEYGYIYGTHEWNDIASASELKERAEDWLDINSQPNYSVKIKAVDLTDAGYDVTAFYVGQFVQVRSDPHGMIDTMTEESSTVDLGIVDKAIVDIGGVAYWFEVNELNLNLLDVSQSFLQLGDEVAGYVSTQARTVLSVVNMLENLSRAYTTNDAVAIATKLITGNSGGYVVLHDSDDDGQPDEILVMDAPSIETAVKVWRWNNSGLGYSSTGYNGSFGLAMTINGQIVADYITTGTMSADRIRAGILQGTSGSSYWNFDTGELYVNGEIESTTGHIGGWTIGSSQLSSAPTSDRYVVFANGTNTNGDVLVVRTGSSSYSYPVVIRADGYASFTNCSITGAVTATSGSFTGTVTATSGSFTGTITSSSATITGGSINITTSSSTDNRIKLTYGNFVTNMNAMALGSTYGGKATTQVGSGSSGGGAIFVYNTSASATISLIGSTGRITCVGLTQTSDQRAKDNIQLLNKDQCSDLIYSLEPCAFEFRETKDGGHHGFIAQSVEKSVGRIYGSDSKWSPVYTPDGENEDDKIRYKSLSYTELIADLVATVQRQNERIKALEQVIV